MLATVLTAMLSVGCSQSEDNEPKEPGFEPGVPTEVSFSLRSRSGNYTRAADGRPQDPTERVEYIHNWWIAFVDSKGNVTVKQRDGASADGFEAETFKVVIPSGTYNIYAFANINVPANSETVVKGLLDNNNTISGKALSQFVTAGFEQDGMRWSSDRNIPMTGYLEGVKIRNTVEEAFSIEVIRAVAKVEFSINNPSEEEVTLKSLLFDRITKSDVSLFPDLSAIGLKAYTPMADADYGTLVLDSYLKAAESTDNVVLKNSKHDFFFYCKESLGSKYDAAEKECFKITLKVDRNRNGESVEAERDFYTTGIINNYINRNDWIRIPIEFSDWKVFWKLRTYPPIGGYPSEFNQNEDGSTLSATVTYGGEFELYPSKILKGANPHDYSGEVDWNKVEVSVVEDDGLFTKAPYLDKYTKAIVGELDYSKVGTAKVRIDFYLEEDTHVTYKLSCTFTIIRTNSAPAAP
ncbi:MAG: hypothetical protein K2H72_08010 [Muribaculaceae bacterium]|nr:hypothetical protein [Muribaculaceae bacterium]